MEILIDYQAVYTKIAQLRQQLQSEMHQTNQAYMQIQHELGRMDGLTNATFMETMQDNRRKAEVTCDTVQKLLTFMELSAREVERNEQMHTRAFQSLKLVSHQRGVDQHA